MLRKRKKKNKPIKPCVGVCARMHARVCVQPVPVCGAGEGVEKAGEPSEQQIQDISVASLSCSLVRYREQFLALLPSGSSPFFGGVVHFVGKVHLVKWGRDSSGNGGSTDPGAFCHPNSWPGQEIGSECFLREPGQAEVSSVRLGCKWNFGYWQPNKHAFHELPKMSFYLKMY